MWVRFLENYSWKPTANTTHDEIAGDSKNLPTAVAEKAIASGKAVPVEGKGIPKKASPKSLAKATEEAPPADADADAAPDAEAAPDNIGGK